MNPPLSSFTNSQSGRTDIYGGQQLLRVTEIVQKQLFTIQPPGWVRQDLGLPPVTGENSDRSLVLTVRSPLATRAVAALDVAYKTYSPNPDPRFMILDLAEAVDLVNLDIAGGSPAPTTCACSDDQANSECQPCVGCLSPTLCNQLAFNDDGGRACPDCIGEVKDIEKVAKAVIWRRLRRRVCHEAFLCGFVWEIAKG